LPNVLSLTSQHADRLDDRNWLAARRAQRWSDKRIAAHLGISAAHVREALRRHGLPHLSQIQYPKLYDEAWMREQIATNRTMADIARELGCSTRSVRDAAARCGRIPKPQPRPQRPAELDDAAWLAAQLAHRTIGDVAAGLGVSEQQVSAAVQRHNVPNPRPRRFPELHDPEWLQARSNRTADEVAAELGCSIHAVKAALARSRVKLRRRSTRRPRDPRAVGE
jgi:DNA-binding CsgD family transcriptional regulator